MYIYLSFSLALPSSSSIQPASCWSFFPSDYIVIYIDHCKIFIPLASRYVFRPFYSYPVIFCCYEMLWFWYRALLHVLDWIRAFSFSFYWEILFVFVWSIRLTNHCNIVCHSSDLNVVFCLFNFLKKVKLWFFSHFWSFSWRRL